MIRPRVPAEDQKFQRNPGFLLRELVKEAEGSQERQEDKQGTTPRAWINEELHKRFVETVENEQTKEMLQLIRGVESSADINSLFSSLLLIFK